MDATGQIFQISKFPDTSSFVIIPRMFWRNLTKIGQIYIPYKFAQSGCIPSKIICMILTHKSSETTCATPGDYLVSWNRKPMGQRDLLASMTMVQDNLCQLQFAQSYIYHMEHGSLPITMTSCEMSVSHKVVFI